MNGVKQIEAAIDLLTSNEKSCDQSLTHHIQRCPECKGHGHWSHTYLSELCPIGTALEEACEMSSQKKHALELREGLNGWTKVVEQ